MLYCYLANPFFRKSEKGMWMMPSHWEESMYGVMEMTY